MLQALLFGNTLRVQRLSLELLGRLLPSLDEGALCRAVRVLQLNTESAEEARRGLLCALLMSAAQQSLVEERDARVIPARILTFSLGAARVPCMQGTLTDECFVEVLPFPPPSPPSLSLSE